MIVMTHLLTAMIHPLKTMGIFHVLVGLIYISKSTDVDCYNYTEEDLPVDDRDDPLVDSHDPPIENHGDLSCLGRLDLYQ